MHNYPQLLGYAVRKARIKKGWTQMETAERAGINIKTIQNILDDLFADICTLSAWHLIRKG